MPLPNRCRDQTAVRWRRANTAGLLRRLHRLDRAAFEAVATARLPGLEYVLPRLSRIADHSVLWLGTAGVLAATRRPRLRRAALRGCLAVGMASPLVNTVGKHAFRRRRPLVDLVPPVRIRWQLPTSPAFPSGHSASAAAFAAGVALEAPRRVALPVAALAGAVAFSRVYNGAHYPGDVLAGVGIGVAAGFTTRALWPSRLVVAHVARTTSAPPAASRGADRHVARAGDLHALRAAAGRAGRRRHRRPAAVSGDLRLARDGAVCSTTPSVVFTKRPGSLAVFTPRHPGG